MVPSQASAGFLLRHVDSKSLCTRARLHQRSLCPSNRERRALRRHEQYLIRSDASGLLVHFVWPKFFPVERHAGPVVHRCYRQMVFDHQRSRCVAVNRE